MAAALAVVSSCADAGPRKGRLHVPSPDWRDQVIYFVLTDRFDDGNPGNNDQGAGEFDRQRATHYQGGDFAGLRRRLDYVQALGATAVWVTPPVANQWVDGPGGSTGYHGYWAEHFGRVDRHLGTLADYQALSRDLHARGMYLVQDIVVNHTGDFFGYAGGWDPADPARFYRPTEGSRPVSRPRQPPFDRNDPRRAADRRAAIYHWTPTVRDYADPVQEATFQMSGLDDLNTDNPSVRRALRRSYGEWIRQAGVDAFRVDTAFYVPPLFFDDFLHARDRRAPGVMRVARATGRQGFFVFGEGFGIDAPGQDLHARKIERWMTAADGRPLLQGMLNFPLYGALGDVLARGQPTSVLAGRIERTMALHARPHLMPTFVDNHDVDRFRAGGSEAALRQALLAIFTLPGVPVVYYGTEQGFTEPRASMFAAGQGSGGRDHFDAGAPMFRWLAALSALRRGDRVWTRGVPTLLQHSAAGPGVIAWRMDLPGRPPALVVSNTADSPVLLDKLLTGLPGGTRLRAQLGWPEPPAEVTLSSDGQWTGVLPARAAWVLRPLPEGAAARPGGVAAQVAGAGVQPASAARPQLSLAWSPAEPSPTAAGTIAVHGQASAPGPVKLVIDGQLAGAIDVSPDAQGQWHARLEVPGAVDAGAERQLVAWQPGSGAVSPTLRFRTPPSWRLAAQADDPAGDDHGPEGRYRYPTDPSYAAARTMDLRQVQAWVAGGSLRLDLEMAGLSRSWNPPNGFDHLALTVYIELPGEAGGATEMPLQQAQLPPGMRWHRRLRVHGWSNALHAWHGASAAVEGTPVAAAARIEVDTHRSRIRLTLPPAAFGGRAELAGARVLVTTWDYDGGYRALAVEPAAHGIGGGDASGGGARVMDAALLSLQPTAARP